MAGLFVYLNDQIHKKYVLYNRVFFITKFHCTPFTTFDYVLVVFLLTKILTNAGSSLLELFIWTGKNLEIRLMAGKRIWKPFSFAGKKKQK